MGTWLFFGVLIAIGVGLVVIYNRLVSLKNRFKNAFAQIDVQLQRRHDLIPNLVETAKAYMDHERETLSRVTEARNQAEGARRDAAADPEDGAAIGRLGRAESLLSGSLSRLLAVSESYPDLKANQTMAELMGAEQHGKPHRLRPSGLQRRGDALQHLPGTVSQQPGQRPVRAVPSSGAAGDRRPAGASGGERHLLTPRR